MIEEIIDTINHKLDDLPVDGSVSNTKLFFKAFALGAAKGVIDGLVIVGAVALIVGTTSLIITATQKN